jgi:hypothetical protein
MILCYPSLKPNAPERGTYVICIISFLDRGSVPAVSRSGPSNTPSVGSIVDLDDPLAAHHHVDSPVVVLEAPSQSPRRRLSPPHPRAAAPGPRTRRRRTPPSAARAHLPALPRALPLAAPPHAPLPSSRTAPPASRHAVEEDEEGGASP